MKTKSNKIKNTESGLQNRIAQHEPEKTNQNTATAQGAGIDFKRRHANRALPTNSVLALLEKEAPRFFEIAEVVGKWVWIQFTEKQPREITAVLAQLGFHWNSKRQVWQHPCGALTTGSQSNPREKYQTYFPADAKPA